MKPIFIILAFGLMASSWSSAQIANESSTTTVPTPASGFLKLETIYSNRDLDAEVVNAITKRMNSDASMKTAAKDVAITSRESVIYVTGKVVTNNERLKILDHARSISAANRVVDQLEIVEPRNAPVLE